MARRKVKPPRVVLLDTREMGSLNATLQEFTRLIVPLCAAAEEINNALGCVRVLQENLSNILNNADRVAGAWRELLEKRSAAARKANATRQAAATPRPTVPQEPLTDAQLDGRETFERSQEGINSER